MIEKSRNGKYESHKHSSDNNAVMLATIFKLRIPMLRRHQRNGGHCSYSECRTMNY